MSKEAFQRIDQIDQNVIARLDDLNQLQSHHQSPGGVLMVEQYIPQEQSPLRELRRFQDGTVLFPVNIALSAILRTFPVGSIVGAIQVRDPISTPEDYINNYETIIAILEQTKEGSLCLGLNRKPRPEENPKFPGKWGQYIYNNGTLGSEKSDAKESLQMVLDPEEGIEAAQILSSVLGLGKLRPNISTSPASEAGCFSHKEPKKAIPQNLLLGPTTPSIFSIDGRAPSLFMRLRQDQFGISPLAFAYQRLGQKDKDRLLSVGLVSKANQIALANPTDMGGGTASGKVLNAILQTIERMNELVPNKATPVDLNQGFRRSLGVL